MIEAKINPSKALSIIKLELNLSADFESFVEDGILKVSKNWQTKFSDLHHYLSNSYDVIDVRYKDIKPDDSRIGELVFHERAGAESLIFK